MKYLCLTIFLTMLVTASNASAGTETGWKRSDEVSARLIAGEIELNDKKSPVIGFQMLLSDKWKTYWRTPGDGGLAFSFDKSKSRNIKSAEIIWPAPTRFVAYETIETFGYSKDVVFPIIIEREDDSKPVHINFTINYAICDELCIFLNNDFELDISPEQYKNTKFSKKIEKYIEPKINFEIKKLEINDERILEIKLKSDSHKFQDPDLFLEAGDDFRFPKAEIFLSGDSKTAIFNVPFEKLLDSHNLEGNEITLTLVDKSPDGKKYKTEKKITLPQSGIYKKKLKN